MSDLLKSIRATASEYERKRNLAGKTRVKCDACNGTGATEPGRTDYDAHGSYYVSPVDCRRCGSGGHVEVQCSPELEASAIRAEIERLQARLKEITP